MEKNPTRQTRLTESSTGRVLINRPESTHSTKSSKTVEDNAQTFGATIFIMIVMILNDDHSSAAAVTKGVGQIASREVVGQVGGRCLVEGWWVRMDGSQRALWQISSRARLKINLTGIEPGVLWSCMKSAVLGISIGLEILEI